jgi:hypothetical protein
MNDTTTFAVVEFYHLPGFMQEETARLIELPVTCKAFCEGFVKVEKSQNELVGASSEYRFEILPLAEAKAKVKATNDHKAKVIAEFRHKVYGEPLTV